MHFPKTSPPNISPPRILERKLLPKIIPPPLENKPPQNISALKKRRLLNKYQPGESPGLFSEVYST